MTVAVSRLLLLLAVRSLGPHRSVWAQAMLAEFEVAEADGQPFSYAFGCLLGAWKTMPYHVAGRFALASHVVCLGIFLPVGAMFLVAAISGFPFVDAGDGISGFLFGTGTHASLLNPGTQMLAPAFGLVMIMLTTCHLSLAWWVLDRNWERVAMVMRFGAATMTTLVIVTCCAALNLATLLLPLAALLIELSAVSALAWWHVERLETEYPEDLGEAS
jgi:hypothetical protein